MSKERSYCFTSYCAQLALDEKSPNLRYCVYQQEKCPETGRLHLQGYIELLSPTRLAAVKIILGDPSAHLEKRRGTREQARSYSMKEETRITGPWEIGTWTGGGQGVRTDIQSLQSALDSGASMQSISDTHFPLFLKYQKGIQSYMNLKIPDRELTTFATVYWGPTGTGKSWRALQEAGANAYWKDPTTTWWDGFSGVDNVVVDEFTGQWPIEYLLRILDKYPLQVQIKGGMVKFAAPHLWLTSNLDPEEWYPTAKSSQRDALRRRLTNVVQLVDVYIEPLALEQDPAIDLLELML